MKYRIDLYQSGRVVKTGTRIISDIDEAIKLAKNVAINFRGHYTKIARVQ